MIHSMCCSSRDLQPPICSSSSSSEFGYVVSDFLQHTHFYSSSARAHTHTQALPSKGWVDGRVGVSLLLLLFVSLRPSFYVWFLLDSCCKKREKEKNLLKKSPTFFCSCCDLDLSLNGEVAAEEERQTDTQTWAFRPRFFIQGPKCSRVVVVVAAAAQQQSVCSNWLALEL